MSIAFAAVDSVGATPPAHFTVAGHVAVRLPVASCTSFSENLPTPTGDVNVYVTFPESVLF